MATSSLFNPLWFGIIQPKVITSIMPITRRVGVRVLCPRVRDATALHSVLLFNLSLVSLRFVAYFDDALLHSIY